jgi:hypothetical protein
MGDTRNAYRNLLGTPLRKKPLGKPRRMWEENIKVDLRKTGVKLWMWIKQVHNFVHWWALVLGMLNPQIMRVH